MTRRLRLPPELRDGITQVAGRRWPGRMIDRVAITVLAIGLPVLVYDRVSGVGD